MQSVPINFENNFVCAKQSVGRGGGGGGGGGWTNGREGKRERRDGRENSIKAKRRKSAPPVTVNFSSGLHLTAA